MKSPTCLELAKRENEELHDALYGWKQLSYKYQNDLHRSRHHIFYTILTLSLITLSLGFISGIYYTWERMGEPVIHNQK